MKLTGLIKATVAALVLFFGAGASVSAQGERAGDFDYYVLSLSWSSAFCALEGDRKREPQCARGRGLTFIMHGLWPQYEQGWPSYCRTQARDPSRGQTAAMADLMGGAGSAFYQWKKHGRCSGLSAANYFATAKAAFEKVVIPPLFAGVKDSVKLPASVVEDAFIEANPGFKRDQVTVTCQNGLIREVRICLDKNLDPRRCGRDVIKDCRLKDAHLEAVR